MRDKRILITGGAGFIGSAVVHGLNQLGREDILVVDHLGTGEKWRNLVPLRFRDYLEKDEFIRLIGEGESGIPFGLGKAGIELDRKALAEMAVNDPAGFSALVETVRA